MEKKLNQKLIKDLKEGKIAVKNKNGCLLDLNIILDAAFKELPSSGNFPYYEALNRYQWDPCTSTSLPSYTIDQFFMKTEFKRGDNILIKTDPEGPTGLGWTKAIFLAYIEGAINPYIVTDEKMYVSGEKFRVSPVKEIKLAPTTLELTLEQIAEKFNTSVENIKIKK